MDGVSGAAAIVALTQVAGNIISYVKNIIDAPAQKRKLLAALVQARGLLSTFVDLTKEVDDEDWSYTIQSLSGRDGPLSTFQDLLERIARKLGITTPGSNIAIALNRLRWPFDQTSLQEMIVSLEQLKSHFLLAIANDHLRLSMAIQNELHEVHSKMTAAAIDTRRRAIVLLSREQEFIVNSLSTINLSGKLDGDEVMNIKAGAEWFLQHNNFQQWHEANPTANTLLLTGPPGSGKTSICEVTRFFLKAWHQSEVDVCVAHVAFNYSQKERLSESAVLSNIVQQIVLERPYLMEYLAALKVTGGTLPLGDSINLLRQARYELKQLYLIIDGLDECEEEMGRAIVKHLLAIEPPLSIIVATRPTMGYLFENPHNRIIVNMDSIVKSASELETIKEMLENDPRIAAYLDHGPENIANAAKLIIEQGDGLLTLMTSRVKLLAQAETRAIFERLLYNQPTSLYEFYQLMLDNVLHQSLEHVALAKKTLRTILATAGPVSISHLMSTQELAGVASTKHLGRDLTEGEMLDACLSSCKGFVISAGEPSTAGLRLQLAHLSVQEFFKTHGLPE